MCMLQSGKGDIREKDAAMTMLNNTSSYSVAPVAFRRSMRFFILRLARFINGFVANVIAQRERQAQLTVLRSLNDRDLMDIGLYRCQIGEGVGGSGQSPIPGAADKKTGAVETTRVATGKLRSLGTATIQH